MLSADGAPFFDIIGDVIIYAWPVDCFLDHGLHFLDPLMGAM